MSEKLKECPACGSDPSEDRAGYVACVDDDCILGRLWTLKERWQKAPPHRSKQMSDGELVARALIACHGIKGTGDGWDSVNERAVAKELDRRAAARSAT